MHPFESTNWRPTSDEVRSFGVTVMIGMPIVGGVFLGLVWWKTGHFAGWPFYLAVGGIFLGLACWMFPKLGRPLHIGWHAVAHLMGFVVNTLLLALVFYLVITPIGLLLRLLGKDPLNRRWDRGAVTYWKVAEKHVDVRSYFRQF